MLEISGKKFKITSRMLKALVEKEETCMNSKEIETSKKKKKGNGKIKSIATEIKNAFYRFNSTLEGTRK